MTNIEPPETLESLTVATFFEANGKVSIHKAGNRICTSDDGPGDAIHFIKYGYIKAYSETDKENVHIIMDTNELFPVLKLIRAHDRRVSYAAITKVKILSIPIDDVIAKLKNDVAFSNSMMWSILRLYRIHADRIDNLEYKQAYERVVYRLVFLTARFGKQKSDNTYLLCKFITHKLIGDTINLSRESVSREISKLQAKNLIGRSDDGMIIHDINKLSAELSWPMSKNLWGLAGDKTKINK